MLQQPLKMYLFASNMLVYGVCRSIVKIFFALLFRINNIVQTVFKLKRFLISNRPPCPPCNIASVFLQPFSTSTLDFYCYIHISRLGRSALGLCVRACTDKVEPTDSRAQLNCDCGSALLCSAFKFVAKAFEQRGRNDVPQ